MMTDINLTDVKFHVNISSYMVAVWHTCDQIDSYLYKMPDALAMLLFAWICTQGLFSWLLQVFVFSSVLSKVLSLMTEDSSCVTLQRGG